jgi:hypothetical protein
MCGGPPPRDSELEGETPIAAGVAGDSGPTRAGPEGVMVMTRSHGSQGAGRRSLSTALTLAALVIVATVLASAAGAAGIRGAAGGPASFTDPTGDAPGAPDVTTVSVDGDAAAQRLTFSVTAPGYEPTTADGLEREVAVWIDTDQNGMTGDPDDGTDYAVIAGNGPDGSFWDVGRWSSSGWGSTPRGATAAFSRTGDVLTWTLSPADIGNPAAFRFYVMTGTWDASDNRVGRDLAPDAGWWSYTLSTAPSGGGTAAPAAKTTLKVDAPKTVPRVAVAGKRFTVTFDVYFEKQEQATVINIGTGTTKTMTMITWEDVTKGKMTCDPSVAGKVIVHAESLANGKARLSFVIPKTARGKLLKVQVRIDAKPAGDSTMLTAKRVATFRVS